MADPRNDELAAFFRRSQQAVEKASAEPKFMASVLAASERIAVSLKAQGKVLLAGNGGSAADAQHLAAEFLSRFVSDRRWRSGCGRRNVSSPRWSRSAERVRWS